MEKDNIAVVAHQASLVNSKTHLIDTLLSLGVNIKKVFAPEHGFRGNADAGERVADQKDPKTGLPILSLYGSNKKPSEKSLDGISIMLLDLQDVGVRFYTYLSTLHYVMEACAEKGIPLIILDRPNPNAHYTDGPVLEEDCKSFVGMHPVPIVSGMTIGEYGKMINGEGWLENKTKANLEVIRIKNYNHNLRYEPPVRPSPNLPNLQSIYLYPSLAFLEKTEVSVGRGTKIQFQIYGHPNFISDFSFTPMPNFGSQYPKLNGKLSFGEDLRNYKTKDKIELKWLIKSYNQISDKTKFFRSDFDKLSGISNLKKQIIEGVSESLIRESWKDGLEKFKNIRKKYLLY